MVMHDDDCLVSDLSVSYPTRSKKIESLFVINYMTQLGFYWINFGNYKLFIVLILLYVRIIYADAFAWEDQELEFLIPNYSHCKM